MHVLVINCGSSSIKYKLYEVKSQVDRAQGVIERIGERQSRIAHRSRGQAIELNERIDDYEQGVGRIIELLMTEGDPPPLESHGDLLGVGHRVVHGGEAFSESVIIDAKVVLAIEECCELAPLHNPANLGGIRATMKILPDLPNVGVFDTAFFQTMPPSAYTYAVPYEWYEQRGVRRYGFHGTSHRYVTGRAAEVLGLERPNFISLHLGNGCSMTCIHKGRAIDQTMGLTPLEGLVMGTRSGDIDPAIIFHMAAAGMDLADIRTSLEKKSGLLGISGVSNDLRDIRQAAEEGNPRAQLAIDVFAHRARKYLGAYLVELGRCDAILFTGGIGEKADWMRGKILEGLEPLGIQLDARLNREPCWGPMAITTDTSPISAWVIPTDEELLIARDTIELVRGKPATIAASPAA